MKMRSVARVLALTVAVALVGSACLPDESLPPFVGPPGAKTVAYVGDSLTKYVEPQVQAALSQQYRTSINAVFGRVLDPAMDTGTGEAQYWTWARAIAMTYNKRIPDYAVVSLGVNDGNRYTFNDPNHTNAEIDAHVAQTRVHLETFIDLFTAARCVVLVTIVPTSWGAPSLQRWFQKWNTEVLPGVAAANPKVRIADWANAVKGHEALWLRDTIHPSDAGATPLGNLIRTTLNTCPA
jgi:lysophospholipase L1-like esterase